MVGHGLFTVIYCRKYTLFSILIVISSTNEVIFVFSRITQILLSRPVFTQETQLSLINRATRLDVIQGHQTWYHSIC